MMNEELEALKREVALWKSRAYHAAWIADLHPERFGEWWDEESGEYCDDSGRYFYDQDWYIKEDRKL